MSIERKMPSVGDESMEKQEQVQHGATGEKVAGENELKNPFGINIHSAKKPIGANPLKYFVDGGYENYEIFAKVIL